jgi:hypothetical protein
MAQIAEMIGNQRRLHGSQQQNRESDYNRRPDNEMEPNGRRKSSFEPERQRDHDKTQDKNHENGRAITGIMRRKIETALTAAIGDIQQTFEKRAVSTAWTTAPQSCLGWWQRRPGLCWRHPVNIP